MANEISVTVGLSGYKSAVMSAAAGRAFAGSFTMTGSRYAEGTLTVATSATAVPLGSVTTPHWAFFYNADATNFVKVRNGASGADLLKLLAGEAAVCPLSDSATPYAIADTAACALEYVIFSL